MTAKFADPIVLICLGILLIGFVFLIWAIGKLRQKSTGSESLDDSAQEDLPISRADLDLGLTEDPGFPARASFDSVSPSAPHLPSPSESAANKEMAERLEVMTHRLAEMQALLDKQNTAPPDSQIPGAAIGQGFSPETIDKLLKIIGNVIQQVDILQKAIQISKEPTNSASASALQGGGFKPADFSPKTGSSIKI